MKKQLKNQVSEEHKNEIHELHEAHREKIKSLQKNLQGWYSEQIEDLKKSHEEDVTKIKEFLKNEQERCMNIYRQEVGNKETQIKELRRQADGIKIEEKARADASARAQIDELRREVSRRIKEASIQDSTELKGEAGEVNLLAILRNEFQQDLFTTQTRGTSGADIIQQIRMASGELLKITIGYDKEANDVDKSDIEKAKRDRDDQGIGYMIIVSRTFPKKDVKNGLLGNSEGILLVRPNILVDLVRTIRTIIVKMSKCRKVCKTKETNKKINKKIAISIFCNF